MAEMYCSICWMRGDILDGRRLQIPAVLTINGLSVCDLAAHQEAALTGNITAALDYLSSGTRQPGPQGEQNHTALGSGRRVRGPSERISTEMLQSGPTGFEILTEAGIVHVCYGHEIRQVLEFLRRDFSEQWEEYFELYPLDTPPEEAQPQPRVDLGYAKGGVDEDMSDGPHSR